jgi:serine/threonine protein kinase
MKRASGSRFELAQWRFVIPESSSSQSAYLRDRLAAEIVAALEGKRGLAFRRSRHATTWKVPTTGSGGEATNIFVKKLDSARGLIGRAKAKSRAKRSEHVRRISGDLRRHNFGVPDVLLIGENRATGDEVIVTSEAPGFMLTRWMNPVHRTELKLRRAILHQLGEEVARLHLGGYVHGDLTPYNIFATGDPPIHITFIDHEGTERTSRVSIGSARNRMRNLVQLGHFNIPGVSRTDKLRVLARYAAAIGLSGTAKRRHFVRLAKMIDRRRGRDRAIMRGASRPAIIAREDTARS